MKVEQLFSCHGISEERKVSLATLSFQGHAMYWWTSLEKEKRINHSPKSNTLPHPKPYKLQWINKEEGIVVNQQVNIPISIGKYKDEFLCNIVPLDVSHILLGKP
uniref:Retrotransposon gag domain-containing protein n=1 Tax=Cajanus cajan TaxID=3821 RepID=A0A151T8H2_CAJCA|nr:hypothetical protein KK1_017873 [Cajanus cajan]